ncbi:MULTISPECIES: hypothetical protein [unclassified Acinetobacter]|uniref:hypothetical protein n=1 Tax=unclassified Acinetobacter TaxID=196816 RepID=UPI002574A59F|nr:MULTISPECIES: hypothetical protein [unclassified Acinetobacter]MDM1765378.1 hypothetical protein [Acinetobacter sp. 226-1]MDM1768883.1 hypothetical protein [Acinetobacter sp. 226-4]
MNDLNWFLSVLERLNLDKNSCNFKALGFLFHLKDKVAYINHFLENFRLSLEKVNDNFSLKILFDQLNVKNWENIMNMESHFFENDDYLFLRLKVFIFDLQTVDAESETIDWLKFFQKKYIESLNLK